MRAGAAVVADAVVDQVARVVAQRMVRRIVRIVAARVTLQDEERARGLDRAHVEGQKRGQPDGERHPRAADGDERRDDRARLQVEEDDLGGRDSVLQLRGHVPIDEDGVGCAKDERAGVGSGDAEDVQRLVACADVALAGVKRGAHRACSEARAVWRNRLVGKFLIPKGIPWLPRAAVEVLRVIEVLKAIERRRPAEAVVAVAAREDVGRRHEARQLVVLDGEAGDRLLLAEGRQHEVAGQLAGDRVAVEDERAEAVLGEGQIGRKRAAACRTRGGAEVDRVCMSGQW